MDDTQTLGDLIRERRLARGFSLGQLATKLGQTAAAVRAWERGAVEPDSETLDSLAEALDIEPDLLERLVETTEPESPSEDDIAADSGESEPPVEAEPMPQAALEIPEDTPDEDGGDDADVVAGVELLDDGLDELDLADIAAYKPPTEEHADATGTDDAEPSDVEPSDVDPVAVELAAGDEPEQGDPEPEQGDPEVTGDAGDRRDTVPPYPGADEIVLPTATPPVPELSDLPTEAIGPPLELPISPVAAAAPAGTATLTAVAEDEATDSNFRLTNPFHVLFDPSKTWLYWIRAALTVVLLLIMARLLLWALSELWDAIIDVLGSFRSTDEVDRLINT